jgi:integrase
MTANKKPQVKKHKDLFKRGQSWYSRFYFEGLPYVKSHGKVSKTTALIKDAEFRTEVLEGKYSKKKKRVLFENFAPQYLEFAKTSKKMSSHERNAVSIEMLMPHFSNKYLHEITPFLVEKYRKERKDSGRMPATINRDVSTLNNMFNMAVQWGYLQVNPINRKVKKLKENNEQMWILSPDDEKNLSFHCEARQQHPRKYLKDLVQFALYTGMREEEIFSLKKINVDMQEGYVHVVDTKNNENRKVPINATVREILNRWLQKTNSDYVFCNGESKKLTVLTHAYLRAVKDAGLERIEIVNGKQKTIRFRFHDLRHTFGSRLGMAGVDLKTIMEIMGHKTVKVALRYQHPTPSHKLNAVLSLDNYGTQESKIMTLVKS